MFNSSPEGSYIDGLNNLEVLGEQQNRIQEREREREEMKELLLRQNLGGGTYSLQRLRQHSRERHPPDANL